MMPKHNWIVAHYGRYSPSPIVGISSARAATPRSVARSPRLFFRPHASEFFREYCTVCGRMIAILASLSFSVTPLASLSAKTRPASIRPHLPQVDAALKRLIDDGQFAGFVTVAYKDGKLIHESAQGKRDIALAAPMTMDSIFRAYSMTKPVTAVAMMILHEQGKWKPQDPVTKFIPELADVNVFVGKGTDGTPIFRKPATIPTMSQLMNQTAGFSYGFFNGYVDDKYRAASLWEATSGDDFVARIAKLPLAYDPGTKWQYSIAVDLQGVIVERLSGQSLGTFMRRHIFGPLKMHDTAFYVPMPKQGRLATVYEWGERALRPAPPSFGMTFKEPPLYHSGGGGLVTTAGDYARFARMLLDKGSLEGVRLLRPTSTKMIMTSQLSPEVVNGGFGIGPIQRIRPGYEYGYDGVVVTDPAAAKVSLGKGSYLWDGAASSWFWVDPTNHSVFVGMVQRLATDTTPSPQRISQAAFQKALNQR